MHEMSLAEGIRAVIEAEAPSFGHRRVIHVRLEIGRFAGVEKRALEFAFDVVMRGSVAADATLEIIDLPGVALCYDCAEPVEIDDRLAPCPRCGGGRLLPQGGDEMRIKNLEVA